MYAIVLSIHNLLRWAVLLTGVYSVLRAGAGVVSRGSWLPADEVARKLFPISLDLQVLVGISLWAFLSPITTTAFHSAGPAMSNPTVRFYLVEHGLAGLLALVFAHIGSGRARRLKIARARFVSLLVFHGVALVLIAARIPWGRPLLRMP
jgi:hypothetical protein